MSDNKAKQDQQMAEARDNLVGLYTGLFTDYLTHGFTRQEALILVQTQILAVCPGGINLPKPPPEGPSNENI